MIESLLLFAITSIIATILTLSKRVETVEIQMRTTRLQLLNEYRNMLDNTSHELKTPLTIIIGHMEILRNQQGHVNCLADSESLDEIQNATIRLKSHLQNPRHLILK